MKSLEHIEETREQTTKTDKDRKLRKIKIRRLDAAELTRIASCSPSDPVIHS